MKDIANYYDIVKIGSHPTIENPGMGLGIKTIAERILFKIIVILSFIFRTIFIINRINFKLINIYSLMVLPIMIFINKDKKKTITFRGSDF